MKRQNRRLRVKKLHRLPRSRFEWLKNKNINIFKYLSILLIASFIISIPTVIKKLIKINKIECQTQYGNCDKVIDGVLNVVGNYKDVKKMLEQRLSNDIQIKSYLIQYKIPSTIKIDLSLKKSKYAIKNQNNNYFLISSDGLVFQIASESSLPTLTTNDSNFKIGDKIADIYGFALAIIEKTSLLYPIQSAVLENNELKVMSNDRILVRFPLEGDVDVLVGSLRLIFSRLNEGDQGIRMEDVHEVDLRFKNPVLR